MNYLKSILKISKSLKIKCGIIKVSVVKNNITLANFC